MVRTFVKEDEPDKKKRKGRQSESISQESPHQRLEFDAFGFTSTTGTQHQ